MRQIRAKYNYKRPKLLQRLFWRWFLVCVLLSAIVPYNEQALTPGPRENSLRSATILALTLIQMSPGISQPNQPDTSTPATESAEEWSMVSFPPFLIKSAEVLEPNNSVDSTAGPGSPISCQDRCGDRISFPCSCTDICIVNGNCCRDFGKWCSQMMKTGRSLFHHLQDAKVECSSKTSTFLIMSCPNRSKVQEYAETSSVKTDRDTGTQSLEQSNRTISLPSVTSGNGQKNTDTDEIPNLQPDGLLLLLLNAPVTDGTTGLVYNKRSIAECNGILDSNIRPWTTQVAVLAPESEPVDLQSLNKAISQDDFFYVSFDPSHDFSKGSECIYYAINQCKAEWLTDNPELEDQCIHGGLTYYKTYTPLPQDYYYNLYCAYCNVGVTNFTQPVFKHAPGEKSFKLSLVASLTSDGIISVRAENGQQFLRWKAFQCSASTQAKDAGECVNKECGEHFKKRSDGMCRRLHKVRFLFGQTGCTFKKSKQLETMLVDFLKCFLYRFESSELEAESAKFDIVVDERENVTLIRTTFSLFYRSYSIPDKRERKWLLRVLLMFVREANFSCDPNLPRRECTSTSCRLGDMEAPFIKTIEPPIDTVESLPSANSSLIACIQMLPLDEWTEAYPPACLRESASPAKLDSFNQTIKDSCFKRYEAYEQRHNLCSRNLAMLTQVWFTLAAIALIDNNFETEMIF